MGPTFPKFASFEIPVIVEIRGAHGHLRLRVQLISDPPFVRHTFVCFPYMPELSVVANPLKSAIGAFLRLSCVLSWFLVSIFNK